MDKIAVGPLGKGAINLEASVRVNIEKTAEALSKKVEDITVVILDRERHADLIFASEECWSSSQAYYRWGCGSWHCYLLS